MYGSVSANIFWKKIFKAKKQNRKILGSHFDQKTPKTPQTGEIPKVFYSKFHKLLTAHLVTAA